MPQIAIDLADNTMSAYLAEPAGTPRTAIVVI